MKKLLFLALSFGLLISCSKDDNNGIPPVDPNKPQPEKPATTLEAKNLKVADYESYRDKKEKVRLHGKIAEVIQGRSYFKFSDGTLVQIFSHKFKELPKEVSDKLKVVGQELTVVGTFTDFKAKDGSIVKEIIYESEADLTFGATPNVQPTPPATEVVELEASTATVKDYENGKAVKIHGNITVKEKKSYFKFSDGTLIQFYVKGYDELPQDVRTKLETEGQEVTVRGTFKTYTKNDKKTNTKTDIRQIVYKSVADLTFN